MTKRLITLEKRESFDLAVENYSVLITDLVLDAKIGIHSYEKVIKQPINILLKLEGNFSSGIFNKLPS